MKNWILKSSHTNQPEDNHPRFHPLIDRITRDLTLTKIYNIFNKKITFIFKWSLYFHNSLLKDHTALTTTSRLASTDIKSNTNWSKTLWNSKNFPLQRNRKNPPFEVIKVNLSEDYYDVEFRGAEIRSI